MCTATSRSSENHRSRHLIATYGYWLDNSWPYPFKTNPYVKVPARWPATIVSSSPPQGTQGETEDSPEQGIEGFSYYRCSDRLEMYQTYTPPDNGNGDSATWEAASDTAPLNMLPWHWSASDRRSEPTDTPYPYPGTTVADTEVSHPDLPRWSAKFLNSTPHP